MTVKSKLDQNFEDFFKNFMDLLTTSIFF